MSLSGEENEIITALVKNESDVFVNIAIVGGEDDPKFPLIQVRGKLKAYKISKTCDAPDIINIQFSQGQVEQLTGYIRGEDEVQLTFVECEPELDFED